MKDKLFIADKIKVGFNPRNDTYSGRLAYVIGHDGKKWRKEDSWNSWRYKYIEPEEYEKLKTEQYKLFIEGQRRWHKNIVSSFNKNPKDYSYYKKEALMTEDEFIKSLNTFEKFTPNIRNISKDSKMKVEEYENVPTEGFVLNKKAGGYSSGWNHRNTYCRVYDPRGFEFEITIPNLLFILQECDSYKGKALEGSFVYAWDGKDLVLLPTSSLDYQESKKFTSLQSGKVSTKELVEGGIYKDKNLNEYVYLGKFYWMDDNHKIKTLQKMFVFYDEKHKKLTPFTSLSTLVKVVDTNQVSNYAELLDIFNNSKHFYEGIDKFEESNYQIQQTLSYSREKLPFAYLKVGNGKYEIYNLSIASSGYNQNYRIVIKSYNLTCNKLLELDGSGFKIKSINTKVLSDLSYDSVKKLQLIDIMIDNKKTYFLK